MRLPLGAAGARDVRRGASGGSSLLGDQMVGGPGFDPGASRSRTGRISCPL